MGPDHMGPPYMYDFVMHYLNKDIFNNGKRRS